MNRILLTLTLFVFSLTTAAQAQDSFAGTYSLTLLNGNPIQPGVSVTAVVVRDPTMGDNFWCMVYVDFGNGNGPVLAENQTTRFWPEVNGKRRGKTILQRELELTRNSDGTWRSKMLSGPNTGVERLWTRQ